MFFLKSNRDELIAPKAQGADFVELFFDLVFVFAITKITHLAAHKFDMVHVFQSVLIFWLVWWGWTQFTWSLNAANTKHPFVRLTVLLATAVAFVMASSIDLAFSSGVMWFAIPYVVVRAIGLGLNFRISPKEDGQRDAVVAFALLSLSGLLAVFLGAFFDASFRMWWWLAAIGCDLMAGFIGGKSQGWRLDSGHFAERHGLIVIIALGESLIVAASAVGNAARSADLLITGGLAVLVTCLLWWSYFAWIHEYLEDAFDKHKPATQAKIGRDAYSFLHFPLICGIIGIAIGFEKILSHPHDVLSTTVSMALGGGVVLYTGFSAAAVWKASHKLLLPRLLILGLTSFAMTLTIGLHTGYILSLLAISLFIINTLEWKKCNKSAA